MQVAYEDFKKDIQGKVILISDTDSQIVQYPIKGELNNLLCFRIVNDEKTRKTTLVQVDRNPVSPKTEIEDTLNGKLFYDTLIEFEVDNPELTTVLTDINNPSEEPTFFSLDLSPSKSKILDDFFNKGNNKFEFANKYILKLDDTYKVPEWIDEIKKMY
ncbi:hypothetical protein [Pedobacter lusitanus]|uniref:hypothetical protein n=1 Tax=Pedobacter lusitanus TaxID=1503925 RepID=UPI000AF5294C|nr:hypothetical protein [Pedobacter lusitanus]